MTFRIGMIGLDTSHSIEFPRLMQSDIAAERQVATMRVVSCLRFPSAFCAENVQDQRQEQLEKWDVRVTRHLEEAVADVDGIMVEINDPALHLDYMRRVAGLGKPVFLDKPLAASVAEGEAILRLVREAGIPFWSASSLRFTEEVAELAALSGSAEPLLRCHISAPLGKAPAGSDVVWYGVHGAEMMIAILGSCAESVFARHDPAGVVAVVGFAGGRRGVLELSRNLWTYSGEAAGAKTFRQFTVKPGSYYPGLIRVMERFFLNGEIPVEPRQTLTIQKILNAIDQSLKKGTDVSL